MVSSMAAGRYWSISWALHPGWQLGGWAWQGLLKPQSPPQRHTSSNKNPAPILSKQFHWLGTSHSNKYEPMGGILIQTMGIYTTNPPSPLSPISYHLVLAKANPKPKVRQVSRTIWRRVESEPGGSRRRQSAWLQWKSVVRWWHRDLTEQAKVCISEEGRDGLQVASYCV